MEQVKCKCGCGNHTKYVRGKPNTYIDGHNRRKQPNKWTVENRGYDSACWIWTGGTNGKYGVTSRKIDGRHRTKYAHRMAYQEHHGVIPDGMLVLHRCDQPLCVRPGHLFAGTHSDNHRDMLAKGRSTNLKITPEMARYAKTQYPGRSKQSIADELGVSNTAISRVIRGLGHTYLD